jgi:hypothetical protein
MGIIFEFLLFDVILGAIVVWTSEVILFMATLGRHKPRRDLHSKESPSRFVIFSESATGVGFLFWLVILYWLER